MSRRNVTFSLKRLPRKGGVSVQMLSFASGDQFIREMAWRPNFAATISFWLESLCAMNFCEKHIFGGAQIYRQVLDLTALLLDWRNSIKKGVLPDVAWLVTKSKQIACAAMLVSLFSLNFA